MGQSPLLLVVLCFQQSEVSHESLQYRGCGSVRRDSAGASCAAGSPPSPGRAQWVAHVDVDTMRGPEVFEKAYAAVTERWGDAGTALQSLRDEFGLDLAMGLHSVTLYGNQFGKPTGVLIANVDVDRATLEGKMKEASGYKTGRTVRIRSTLGPTSMAR